MTEAADSSAVSRREAVAMIGAAASAVLAPVGSVTARQTAANTVSGIVYENRSRAGTRQANDPSIADSSCLAAATSCARIPTAAIDFRSATRTRLCHQARGFFRSPRFRQSAALHLSASAEWHAGQPESALQKASTRRGRFPPPRFRPHPRRRVARLRCDPVHRPAARERSRARFRSRDSVGKRCRHQSRLRYDDRRHHVRQPVALSPL